MVLLVVDTQKLITNSTFDNDFMTGELTYKYYNEFIWNKRYAECISYEEAIRLLKGQI